MGFFDSFQNASKKKYEESSESTNRLRRDKEQKQREAEIKQHELNSFYKESDSSLLQKYNSFFTSQEIKKKIEEILYTRGYYKTRGGNWDR